MLRKTIAEDDLVASEWRECPFVVASGLTEADALIGQFELICADCINDMTDKENTSLSSNVDAAFR